MVLGLLQVPFVFFRLEERGGEGARMRAGLVNTSLLLLGRFFCMTFVFPTMPQNV